MSYRRTFLAVPMGLFSRRPPRHRQLLYFVLGIVIFNIAVSYYYHNLSQKHRLETGKEGYIGGFYLYDTSEDNETPKEKEENYNAKRNSVDAMPISVDVKKFKISSSSPKRHIDVHKLSNEILVHKDLKVLLNDLKIAEAINDLPAFASRKEKEEAVATKGQIMSRGELIAPTVLPIISSQSQDERGETKLEASDYDELQGTEKTQVINLQKSRLSAIETLYNPWLSKYHNHKDNDTSKITSEDFVIKLAADTGCSIRKFKNVTIYSSSDFIHEYIDYKTCLKQKKGTQSQMAEWQQKLIVKTGSKGQLIVDSTNEYDINQKDFCASHPKTQEGRKSHTSPKVLYLILSNSTNIDGKMRESIRQSWSKDVNKTLSENHKVVFFLGRRYYKKDANFESELQHDIELINEAEKYKDLVRTDVSEADPHYNLKQTIAMLSWAYKHCQLARFVVKTTSNTYANLNVIEQFAEQEMYAANRIYGSILKRMLPDRSIKGLHYIGEEEWPWDYLPPFLKDPSFILSGDVVPRLLLAASVTPPISLDMVYIAGILPALLGLSRIEVNSFFRSAIPEVISSTMIDKSNECSYGKYGIIHGVKKPLYMFQIDELIHDMHLRNVTCSVAPKCIAKVEGKCVLRGDEDEDEKDPKNKASRKKTSPLLKASGKILGNFLGDKTAVFG